jgi:hypothetical protein
MVIATEQEDSLPVESVVENTNRVQRLHITGQMYLSIVPGPTTPNKTVDTSLSQPLSPNKSTKEAQEENCVEADSKSSALSTQSAAVTGPIGKRDSDDNETAPTFATTVSSSPELSLTVGYTTDRLPNTTVP